MDRYITTSFTPDKTNCIAALVADSSIVPEGEKIWRHGVDGTWSDREITVTRLELAEAEARHAQAEAAVLAGDEKSFEQASGSKSLVVHGFPDDEARSDHLQLTLRLSEFNGEYKPNGAKIYGRPVWSNNKHVLYWCQPNGGWVFNDQVRPSTVCTPYLVCALPRQPSTRCALSLDLCLVAVHGIVSSLADNAPCGIYVFCVGQVRKDTSHWAMLFGQDGPVPTGDDLEGRFAPPLGGAPAVRAPIRGTPNTHGFQSQHADANRVMGVVVASGTAQRS